jgi:hypothetical protein
MAPAVAPKQHFAGAGYLETFAYGLFGFLMPLGRRIYGFLHLASD